ncbi:MAG: methyltransferase domain-containing protein [Deltaproteobacteria bacterium]|nr:methyltransferase domain-containing protein [Deltaproteobacteria bacterium]
MEKIFDEWPEKYDQWFRTPIGRLVKEYEKRLILEMAQPGRGEMILDAGCGTGVFTRYLLITGARVVGLDVSLPMLRRAKEMLPPYTFRSIKGDMGHLPFPDNRFDKFISITAIEFLEDARGAVLEAFRVTKPGGSILVATLNSISPWASRRMEAAKKGHSLFRQAVFRSPAEIRALAEVEGSVKTAIHFGKDEDPLKARTIEESGRLAGLMTGAFLAVKWVKPV